MSKRKRGSTTSKDTETTKERGPQKQFQVKGARTIRSEIWRGAKNILGSRRFWVVFMLTIGSSLYFLRPRISIYPGESLNWHNPFSTPFIIKNDGYLPVLDLHYSLKYEDIELKSGSTLHKNTPALIGRITELKGDRSHPIFLGRSIEIPPDQVKAVIIFFTLSYRPFLIPYTFTEDTRFKTEMKTTGEYVWFKYHGNQ